MNRTAFGTVAVAFAIMGASPMSTTPAPAPPSGVSQEETNRNLVRAGLQAWAERTGSPYDLLADNASWTITGNSLAAKTYPSKEAFMAEVIRPFNARMRTPLTPKVRNLYSDGNTVVAFFDAEGTALDGKPYRNTYAWILELSDGKIVRANAFFDSIAFDDLWRRVQPPPPRAAADE